LTCDTVKIKFSQQSNVSGFDSFMAKKSNFELATRFIKNLKLIYIIIAVLVLAIIVVRLALPAIVKNYVNKKLNELPGYTGHVDNINIHLIRGAYTIDIIRLTLLSWRIFAFNNSIEPLSKYM
jgi:uncharacterized membrane protein (UPF0182 family)